MRVSLPDQNPAFTNRLFKSERVSGLINAGKNAIGGVGYNTIDHSKEISPARNGRHDSNPHAMLDYHSVSQPMINTNFAGAS